MEPVHKKTGLIVDGKTEGSLDASGTALLDPCFGGSKEPGEYRFVINAIEKPELPGGVVIPLNVKPVDLRGNSTHGLAAAPGNKKLRLGVAEVRVLANTKMLASLKSQGSDPIGVIGKNGVGEGDKVLQVTARMHREYFDIHHRGHRCCDLPTEEYSPIIDQNFIKNAVDRVVADLGWVKEQVRLHTRGEVKMITHRVIGAS
jgi:hypothetical protein